MGERIVSLRSLAFLSRPVAPLLNSGGKSEVPKRLRNNLPFRPCECENTSGRFGCTNPSRGKEMKSITSDSYKRVMVSERIGFAICWKQAFV